MFYRQHKFTCEATAKDNLTYYEAIDSEREYFTKNILDFPSYWLKPALELIHSSTPQPLTADSDSINDLIQLLFDYFSENIFLNEDVSLTKTNQSGKIISILPDKDKPLYKVIHNDSNEESIVAFEDITRNKKDLCKNTLKSVILHCAGRGDAIGASWYVKVQSHPCPLTKDVLFKRIQYPH